MKIFGFVIVLFISFLIQMEAMKAQEEEEEKVQRFPGNCINTKEFCKKGYPGQRFFDGCNFCSCSYRPDTHPGAACHRVACHPFRGTKSEYKEYCRKKLEAAQKYLE